VTQPSPRPRKSKSTHQDHEATNEAAFADGRRVLELAQALTALKKNTDELLQRKKQLQQLNRWFDVALNNMARGLSMFDSDQRLIVCNKLYREIYDLPTKLTRPGTSLSKILRYHVKQQTGRDDPHEVRQQQDWIEKHVAKLLRGETFTYTQQLKSGRIVQVTNQPLAGGGWVDIQEDITERRKAEQRITWLARHDPLTETANRMYFSEELEHALKQLSSGSGFALHWIDLDHFKQINDGLGHPAGDAILKSVAKRLKASVRAQDLVARLGGDEFAVIQTGVTTPSEVLELTKRLLATLNGPHDVLGQAVEIGASIGVVLAPEHGTSADDLMKNVDQALYDAKLAGRGTFAIFEGARAA